MTQWKYEVQTVPYERRRLDSSQDEQFQVGFSWMLCRCASNGTVDVCQPIVASPDIFSELEDAKRDALEKLSMLNCTLENPLAEALRDLHQDL